MSRNEATSNKETRRRFVIVGVGNLLLKDEGVGIHAVKTLQELNLPEYVEIIDGGTSPDFVAYSEAASKLIIIDAVKAGGEPGAIYRFTPDNLDSASGKAISLHELGVPESLQLMRLAGSEPEETVIIGIEPKEIDWGMELSADVQQVIPRVIQAILREIDTDK